MTTPPSPRIHYRQHLIACAITGLLANPKHWQHAIPAIVAAAIKVADHTLAELDREQESAGQPINLPAS